MTRTTVLMADDHALLMDGLIPLVRQEFEIIGVARDGRAMIQMARHHHPDVIVSDISMPHLNGIDAARILQKEANCAKLLFMSMHADLPLVAEANKAEVSRENSLTLRQREVLQLLAEGKTMKEVAALLGISTRTAESHKYEIMRQLGVQTTADIIRYAVRIKLV